MRHIAVIDIGKTNAKMLSVDLATGRETIIARCANQVQSNGPYPSLDATGIWTFLQRA